MHHIGKILLWASLVAHPSLVCSDSIVCDPPSIELLLPQDLIQCLPVVPAFGLHPLHLDV